MAIGYVLYNKKAGNNKDISSLQVLEEKVSVALKLIDIESIKSYADFFKGMMDGDFIILCGGDGTLNRFINNVKGLTYTCEVLYYPWGTGNDFAHEVGCNEKGLISLHAYIENLPTVCVNGHKYHFLNGVGFGIDGYCCEVGDKQKLTSKKPVNYTSIAIKGLLFHYKPTAATVTVDGVTHTYKKVWLAPTMLGKYYGGGMIPTPGQDRASDTLSTLVFHGSGKLRTLMIFPNLFKGEHVKYTKHVEILKGREITVTFDRPTALQIDGETLTGVTSYTAYAAAPLKAAPKQQEAVTV